MYFSFSFFFSSYVLQLEIIPLYLASYKLVVRILEKNNLNHLYTGAQTKNIYFF